MTARRASGAAWAEIVEVIGDEAAARLATAFPGMEIFVPAKMGLHHPIVAAIGAAAAAALADIYHNTQIYVIRRDARADQVRKLAASGRLTRQAIAEAVGMTERHVYRLLADPDDSQIEMFADR